MSLFDYIDEDEIEYWRKSREADRKAQEELAGRNYAQPSRYDAPTPAPDPWRSAQSSDRWVGTGFPPSPSSSPAPSLTPGAEYVPFAGMQPAEQPQGIWPNWQEDIGQPATPAEPEPVRQAIEAGPSGAVGPFATMGQEPKPRQPENELGAGYVPFMTPEMQQERDTAQQQIGQAIEGGLGAVGNWAEQSLLGDARVPQYGAWDLAQKQMLDERTQLAEAEKGARAQKPTLEPGQAGAIAPYGLGRQPSGIYEDIARRGQQQQAAATAQYGRSPTFSTEPVMQAVQDVANLADDPWVRFLTQVTDVIDPNSPRHDIAVKLAAWSNLSPKEKQQLRPQYDALVEAVVRKPTLALLSEGAPRAAAGLFGQLLKESVTLQPETKSFLMRVLDAPPEQRAAMLDQWKRENWDRWQTEQQNPAFDMLVFGTNPIGWTPVGDPELALRGAKAVGQEAASVGRGAVQAAREAVPAAGRALGQAAEAAGPLAKEFVLAGERGALEIGQEAAEAGPFYSQLGRALESPKLPNKASAQQMLGTLKGKELNVKDVELTETGVKALLDERLASKQPVTRAELQEAFLEGQVKVEEVVKGGQSQEDLSRQLWELNRREAVGETLTEAEQAERMRLNRQIASGAQAIDNTKFSQYQLPGAEEGSYRELLMTLPSDEGQIQARMTAITQRLDDLAPPGRGEPVGMNRAEYDRLRQELSELEQGYIKTEPGYRSPHWSEPNVLAHLRFNTRYIDGKKTMLLEEFQSDLTQRVAKLEGLVKRGKASQSQIDELARLKQIPLADRTPQLMMKRAINWAAANGYDRISWTTGKQQVDRWTNALRKNVDRIEWTRGADDQVRVTGSLKGQATFDETVPLYGEIQLHGQQVDLEDIAGKKIANDIRDATEMKGAVTGDGLTIGGEGLMKRYDEVMRNVANDLGKRHGARVTTAKLNTSGVTDPAEIQRLQQQYANKTSFIERNFPIVHSLDLTPSLITEAKRGFPLFSSPEIGAGLVSAATAFDPDKTMEENAQAMALRGLGGAAGMGAARQALKRGIKPGLTVEDVSKAAKEPWEMMRAEFELYPLVYRGAKSKEGQQGLWFTPSKRYASHYAHRGGTVEPYRIVLRNPLNRDTKRGAEIARQAFQEAGTHEGGLQRLEAMGYDALTMFRGSEIEVVNRNRVMLADHRGMVAQALSEGKPVPPEVLKEYPDLAAKVPASETVPDAYEAARAYGDDPAKQKAAQEAMRSEVEQRLAQATPEQRAAYEREFGTSEALTRARGTVEQAAELRPPEEGFAGNIRLEKFPEDIRDAIRAVVDEQNQFAGQRRGVITDEEALRNAAETALGTSIEDWLKTKPGRSFSQEEAIALGQTVAKARQDYDALQATVAAARSEGTVTPAMEARLAEQALQWAALVGVRSGAAAEAGRSLRAFRQALTGENASREKAIQQAFSVLGGTERFTKWLDEFNQIDPSNTAARYKMLQSLHDSTLWDKLTAWRYASMLSSWKTHSVNFISNAQEAMDRPTTLLLAGYGREAQADVYGMLRGVPEGVRAAGDAFSTGVSQFNVSQMETVRPRALGSGKFGRAVTAGSDALMAADDFWKSVNYFGAMHAEAYRLAKGNVAEAERLLREPTAAMVKRAEEAAKIATFQNNPNELVRRIIGVANTPGAPGFAVRLVLPFIRTPANIYIRGLNMVMSPVLGPAKIAIKAAQGDMRAARLEAAKTMKAMGALAGLYGMAQSGMLSGQGPSDPAKRRVLEESGWQANSINIGGRWLNYSNLGPLSVPMAFVAAVKEGMDEGQRPNRQMAADVGQRVYNSMLDVSFLRGLSDLLRAESIESWVAQNAASIAGSFVPYGAGLAAAERVIDPTLRARDNPASAVQGRLPLVSQLLPSEPSIYGGTRQTTPNDTIAQILLPWQSSVPRQDPVANEVARLNQSPETRQAGVAVSVRQFKDQYAGAKQTPEQKRLLQSEAGQMAATYIAETISRPDYQQLSDVQKAQMLNKMLGTAYDLADLQLGERVSRDERHQALLAWANVPHYLSVKGTAPEIRRQNYEISQAKAKLAEYKRVYGRDMGEIRLLKDDKNAWKLAQREDLPKEILDIKKRRIDKAFGGVLLNQPDQALVGSGNTLVPVGR